VSANIYASPHQSNYRKCTGDNPGASSAIFNMISASATVTATPPELQREHLPPLRFSSPVDRPSGPLTVPTLVEKAHEHLVLMLMAMEIAPGARIPIDTVARSLGISQTPVREALSRLEAEGLVTKAPNVGYRASAQMTREEVNDLFVMRALIEPYAAARAAEGMPADIRRQIAEIGEEMAQIQQAGARVVYARFADADATLHRLVTEGSGNRLIAEAIERLHIHLHLFRFLYNTNAPEEAAREHGRIIEALLAGDPAGAEAAMRDHLENSRQRMDEALTRLEHRAKPRTAPAPTTSLKARKRK
jgi:DNA-binding GntR family transcriptional regulator